MQWYRILAQILPILSVINFALAAPVVVQQHEVRASVVDLTNDGTTTSALRRDPSFKWPASVADQTNASPISRSSDSGILRGQEPMQHNLRSPTDSNDLPEPSNPPPPKDLRTDNAPSPSVPPGFPASSPMGQAPSDEPNPSSPHGNTDFNTSPYQGPTDNSHR
jgi:hypothetical protein